MKKKKKLNTTDEKRIIFKDKGMIEQSVSARGNWDLWKLAMSFEKLEEIEALISVRKNKIKHEKNPNEVNLLRRDVLILEDARKIKLRRPCLEVSKKRTQKRDILESTYLCGERVLSKLGFSEAMIYKEDLNNIIERIDELFLSDIGQLFEEEILSVCIVAEILMHYNAKFSEWELITFYDLSEEDFYELRLKVRNWCEDRYWIN